MNRLRRRALARAFAAVLVTAMLPAACTTDPLSAPLIAVLDVSVAGMPADGVLLLNATRTLTATVLGPADSVLADRPVAWSSTAPEIAAVSDEGRVEAVSTGEATIKARSGGRTGVVPVSVREGTTVPASGGTRTVNLLDNRLRLSVPVGVAPSGTVIHAREALAWPPNGRILAASVVELGPDGTELAASVTVGVTFTPADIPAAERSQLRLHGLRADGQWEILPSASVDLNAFRVSAGLMRLTKVAIFRPAMP